MCSSDLVSPGIAAGKVKALAVLDGKRYARLPNVPSISETLPGFRSAPLWFASFGPAGLPRPITLRLQEAFSRTAMQADVRATLEERGMKVIASTPEELASVIKADIEMTAGLVKSLGLKPE